MLTEKQKGCLDGEEITPYILTPSDPVPYSQESSTGPHLWSLRPPSYLFKFKFDKEAIVTQSV